MDFEHCCEGGEVKKLCSDETCVVYQLKEASGEGLMTMYTVFPGCYVLYNDFHMKTCHSGFRPESAIFCIDHCREGRIEWERGHNRFVYVASGDMLVDCRDGASQEFFFPLEHYHGVCIGVDLSQTDGGVLHLMDDFSVDLNHLRQKFCPADSAFIMRSHRQIDRIFSELYDLPEKVRRTYFKIKIMELFLLLENLSGPEQGDERPYFYRTQVDKIKHIVELQTADLTRWYTLEELSAQFEFPLTGMKRCFKGMYGCTMAEYMKKYRMNTASELLRTTRMPVIEIAASVGYENPGKFSSAFRSVTGMTPTAYRKKL